MSEIEVVLTMLLAVAASGYLTRLSPIAIPLPLVQILLGAVIAAVSTHSVTLDPEIFFLLLLPPLLFLDGWRIPKEEMFRDGRIILALALGLVVFTVVGAGFFIHWMLPSMPLAVAFALAAIVSPTDPVAVSSIAAKVPIPKRMMHILEGESLLNDASGLVCFRFAVAAASTGIFSLTSATLTFLWVALAGLVIGAGLTWGISVAQNWISRRLGEEAGTPILINLLIPFGAYMAAEHVGASGILAAVAAGISMSYVEMSGRTLAATRVQRSAVWDTIQFSLNGAMFVLLGEQLPTLLRSAASTVQQADRVNPWWLLAYAMAINLGLVALRFTWVWISLYWGRLLGHSTAKPLPSRVTLRLIAAMSFAGVRGAVTLAGVATLPVLLPSGSAFPSRDLAIFLAMTVILMSLLGASLLLPPLLQGLDLPLEHEAQRKQDMARQAAATAAVNAIHAEQNRLSHTDNIDADILTDAAARAMQVYQRRLDNAAGADPQSLRKADRAERLLRLAGLRAERECIFKLAQHRQIPDEVSRKLVRELDLLEERLSS